MARGRFETGGAFVQGAVDVNVSKFPALEAGFMVTGIIMGQGNVMVTASPPNVGTFQGGLFFFSQRGRRGRGVEFFEAVVASSMRFWVEANSFRYLSRLTTKLVMPSWCMTEMSSTQSRVCTSWTMCFMVGAMELWVMKGEFMITSRCSTWK